MNRHKFNLIGEDGDIKGWDVSFLLSPLGFADTTLLLSRLTEQRPRRQVRKGSIPKVFHWVGFKEKTHKQEASYILLDELQLRLIVFLFNSKASLNPRISIWVDTFTLKSDGSQALRCFHPQTNSSAWVSPKAALPVGSAGIVHFMVDGTEQSWEKRERVFVDEVFRSPLMHRSEIRPLTHHSCPSPLNCGETLVQTRSMHVTTKAKWLLTRERTGCLHLQEGNEEG